MRLELNIKETDYLIALLTVNPHDQKLLDKLIDYKEDLKKHNENAYNKVMKQHSKSFQDFQEYAKDDLI